MLLGNSAMGNNKKSRFIKQQGASRLLSQLGIRNPLNKIPLLGNFLLKKYNKISEFLLTGDKLKTIYKSKERIQKLKERESLRYIYQNIQDEPCFQHYITFGAYKNRPCRTAS